MTWAPAAWSSALYILHSIRPWPASLPEKAESLDLLLLQSSTCFFFRVRPATSSCKMEHSMVGLIGNLAEEIAVLKCSQYGRMASM